MLLIDLYEVVLSLGAEGLKFVDFSLLFFDLLHEEFALVGEIVELLQQ